MCITSQHLSPRKKRALSISTDLPIEINCVKSITKSGLVLQHAKPSQSCFHLCPCVPTGHRGTGQGDTALLDGPGESHNDNSAQKFSAVISITTISKSLFFLSAFPCFTSHLCSLPLVMLASCSSSTSLPFPCLFSFVGIYAD